MVNKILGIEVKIDTPQYYIPTNIVIKNYGEEDFELKYGGVKVKSRSNTKPYFDKKSFSKQISKKQFLKIAEIAERKLWDLKEGKITGDGISISLTLWKNDGGKKTYKTINRTLDNKLERDLTDLFRELEKLLGFNPLEIKRYD